MTPSTLTKIQFDNFVWIDICQPNQENLDKIAQEYQLDYFQIKDSLERGHLPKFEKQPNYNFLILRAFTPRMASKATTINELSHKIAFFYNGYKIITIHRSPFAFLETVKKDHKTPEEILIYLIHKMVETYQVPLNDLDEKSFKSKRRFFCKTIPKYLWKSCIS